MAFIAAGSTLTATTSTEGTWTLATSDNSFSEEKGFYVRIGDLCYCYGEGRMNSNSSANDNFFYLTGLPITPYSGSDHGYSGVGPVGHGNMRLGSNHYRISIQDDSKIVPRRLDRDNNGRMNENNAWSAASGIERNENIKTKSDNSNHQWLYVEFTYHV